MWTGKMILVLSAALLALPPACADESGNTSSNTSISHEPPRVVWSDNEGAVNGGSYSEDRGGSYEDETPGQIQDRTEKKNARSNSALSGFHWTADGDRPALAYHFSETGVARLRGNVHGARVVLDWHY